MSAEAAAFSRSWKVGRRTVTLTSPAPSHGEVRTVTIEWSPDMPTRLTEAEWREYRAGRSVAALELGRLIGGAVAVVEV